MSSRDVRGVGLIFRKANRARNHAHRARRTIRSSETPVSGPVRRQRLRRWIAVLNQPVRFPSAALRRAWGRWVAVLNRPIHLPDLGLRRGMRSCAAALHRLVCWPGRALRRGAQWCAFGLRRRLVPSLAAASPFAVLALGVWLPLAVATPDAGTDGTGRTRTDVAGARLPETAVPAVSAPPASSVAKPVVDLVPQPATPPASELAAVTPPAEAHPEPIAAERPTLAPDPADAAAAQPPAKLAESVAPPEIPAKPVQAAAARPASPAPVSPESPVPLHAELPSLDCVIEPDLVVALGSPVPGVIEHIAVERSDVVEEGQVLVELEAGPEKAAVAVAQARASLKSEVRVGETSLALGERQAARNEQLFANRAVSMDTKDEAATEAILARLRLDQARENRRLAELELARAQAALDQRTLRSPVRGVVVERLMAPGELVSDQPILRLARIDPLKVEVIAPADLYGSVRRGMRAEITPEAPGRGSFAADVTVVDAVIDAASGTFGVGLTLPNPDHAIPGGLRCKVRFLVE